MDKIVVFILSFFFLILYGHSQVPGTPSGMFFEQATVDVPLTFVGATHSQNNCLEAGGAVYTTPSGTICRFSGASCPGGWLPAANWSTTVVGSQDISWGAISCPQASPCKLDVGLTDYYPQTTASIIAGSATRVSGSHAWSDTVVETSSVCRQPTGCANLDPSSTNACDGSPNKDFEAYNSYDYTDVCNGTGTQTVTYKYSVWHSTPSTEASSSSLGFTNFSVSAVRTERGCI